MYFRESMIILSFCKYLIEKWKTKMKEGYIIEILMLDILTFNEQSSITERI